MPPVDYLGFVDFEPVIVVGDKARGLTNSTVDVEHNLATAADQMVVIVPHPIFETRWGSSWLNTSDETFFGKDPEGVIYGLTRNRADDGSHIFCQVIGSGVRPVSDRLHDRQPLRSNLHSPLAQLCSDVIIHPKLVNHKFWTKSIIRSNQVLPTRVLRIELAPARTGDVLEHTDPFDISKRDFV